MEISRRRFLLAGGAAALAAPGLGGLAAGKTGVEMDPRADPVWMGGAPTMPSAPRFEGDRKVDLAIVGGGYTGLSCAYYVKLFRPDWSVVVLESHKLDPGINTIVTDSKGGIGYQLSQSVQDNASQVIKNATTLHEKIHANRFDKSGTDRGILANQPAGLQIHFPRGITQENRRVLENEGYSAARAYLEAVRPHVRSRSVQKANSERAMDHRGPDKVSWRQVRVRMLLFPLLLIAQDGYADVTERSALPVDSRALSRFKPL